MILWLLTLWLFGYSIYKAIKLHYRQPLFYGLISMLIIGATDFALYLYYFNKTDCGAKYYIDTGCTNALPNWTMVLGLAALFLSMIFSGLILYQLKDKKLK